MAETKYVTLDILSYFKEKMDASVDSKVEGATPYINAEGNWCIGNVDTGYSAIVHKTGAITSQDIMDIFARQGEE